MWQIIQQIISEYPSTRYSVQSHSMGIPVDVVWREQVIRKSNGYVHCSGATWAVAVELLRLFGEEMDTPTSTIRELREWAWCIGDRRGGLPEGLCNHEFATAVPINDLQEGDFVQIWRLDGSGHSFIFAGMDGDAWLEWSASSFHEHGTGIKKVWGQDQLEEVFAARFHQTYWKGN